MDRVDRALRKITSQLQFLPNWAIILVVAGLAGGVVITALSGNYPSLTQAGWSSLLIVLALVVCVVAVQDWLSVRSRLLQADRQVAEARQQVEAVLRLSSRFAEAGNANEVVHLVLRACIEAAGALGASFVPLDDHGQPLQPTSLGRMPEPRLEDWNATLEAPHIGQACKTCSAHLSAEELQGCPLHPGPYSGARGLACLPVAWGGRQLGMVVLHREEQDDLPQQARDFLTGVIDEMALALEAIRLRDRELTTLRKMQAFKQQDLDRMLSLALDSTANLVEADFACLLPLDSRFPGNPADLRSGLIPDEMLQVLPAFARRVRENGSELVIESLEKSHNFPSGWRGVAGCLVIDAAGRDMAVLAVGSRSHPFNARQLAVLETACTQIALLAGYSQLVEDLEFQAMMAERRRLAREIHDGLAQTLGFLKLMSAQQQGYLERGQMDRLRQNLELTHATLAGAYEDIRQTIDGLRISPETGLMEWIRQTVTEFEALSGLPVEVGTLDFNDRLETEVQAQLARIMQEALANIRKHAQANRVRVSCRDVGSDLVLEIHDDGKGFEPEDILSTSQHGIKGMRERAELIGADFQIRSCPEAGTVVAVHIPQPVEGVAP